MQDILVLICSLSMPFRVAGTADAEIALRLDIAHQFGRVVVIICRCAALGNVPTQCEHVFDPLLPELFQHSGNMLLGRGDAGQVGQHGNAVFLLQVGCDMHGVLAGAAACSVCNTHEIRAKRRDLLRCLRDRFVCAAGLWREHLKGQRDLILFQKVGNFHRDQLLFFRIIRIVFSIAQTAPLFPDINTL